MKYVVLFVCSVVVSVFVSMIALTGADVAMSCRIAEVEDKIEELLTVPPVAVPEPVYDYGTQKRVAACEASLSKMDMAMSGEVKTICEAINARHKDIMAHELRLRKIEHVLSKILNSARRPNATARQKAGANNKRKKTDKAEVGPSVDGPDPKVSGKGEEQGVEAGVGR